MKCPAAPGVVRVLQAAQLHLRLEEAVLLPGRADGATSCPGWPASGSWSPLSPIQAGLAKSTALTAGRLREESILHPLPDHGQSDGSMTWAACSGVQAKGRRRMASSHIAKGTQVARHKCGSLGKVVEFLQNSLSRVTDLCGRRKNNHQPRITLRVRFCELQHTNRGCHNWQVIAKPFKGLRSLRSCAVSKRAVGGP